jgi:succinate dehydrogenase hydrophobic anchor subunit
MDKDFPDGKWFRTFILLGHMSGLEEWLVSLYGVSGLSSIMSDYSDGVWFREMMQLMTLIVMMVLMI